MKSCKVYRIIHIPGLLFTCVVILLSSCHTQKELTTRETIIQSVTLKPEYMHVDMQSMSDSVYLRIHGQDIEVDFNHMVIDGRMVRDRPDQFTGIGIYIYDSKNVTVRNVSLHGFKIAILAENVEDLKFVGCDLSYNYRPELLSSWDKESLSDWLYFHHNEQDEWKRYGAAIYLKDCAHALVKDVKCHQGMNGLLMVGCTDALVYNNDISFNSGLGIGLYRSNHNRIMHNTLDWNVRGYSHDHYARGQDSAAILLYEQSSSNIIAFNSATHSGDGVFLWAGQQTMDTGLGGCDSNLVYQNDFSHSVANGVEVTFSSNIILENKLNDCRYGVWGGYSHHSIISGNEIQGCDEGIAIEHGNHNMIERNKIVNCQTGIHLWQREAQPEDWPYAQVRDVRSRKYLIRENLIKYCNTGVEASSTDSIVIIENHLLGVTHERTSSGTPSHFIESRRAMDWELATPALPEPLPDGMSVELAPDLPQGREFILVNEWGPYDYQYPYLALWNKEQARDPEVYRFHVFAPRGSWAVNHVRGFYEVRPMAGAISDTITGLRFADSTQMYLKLMYTGEQCVTQFGDTIPAATPYPLTYAEAIVNTNWQVSFFQFDDSTDPLIAPKAFSRLLETQNPLVAQSYHTLNFRWWDSPGSGVPADKFAIKAATGFIAPGGKCTFRVESDDGVRLWLDDKLILERWDVHTPEVDETTVNLPAGKHTLKCEYFDAGGLAVLDVSIQPDVAGMFPHQE